MDNRVFPAGRRSFCLPADARAAQWRTDKYAALYMRKRGFGRIINISSTSGMYGTPKLATYCMAKWGVRGLTKTLAQELKGTGIVVNTVCPTKD